MTLTQKILKEYSEDILNKKIKNPETGRSIKVSSALAYDDTHPVHQAALNLVQKVNSGPATVPGKAIKTVAPPTKNARSHKPKSASYGVSKECVSFLKEKGFTGLNAYPQSFVNVGDIIINPQLKTKSKDSTWVAKFPVMTKAGAVGTKTAYTAGFMKKNQIKKYKKISRIKETDIVSLEQKSDKLLIAKDRTISDSAAIIKIMLKTALRVGSLDNDDEAGTGNRGVRTLKSENVQIEGTKVYFNFIGKSYQENIATLDDANLAAYLTKIKSDNPQDNLFSSSYDDVKKLMKKINPKEINPKDIRTYMATKFAKELLADKKLGAPPPLPKEPKEIKRVVKEKIKVVFDRVSAYLNNSPAMARNSYVHPIVITNFLTNLGLTPKEVGYKHITLPESISMIGKILLEAIGDMADEFQFDTMDEMFEKNSEYGNDVETDDISDEDSDLCEEYELPIWFYSDNWVLVPKDEI